eukprot:TRINITY_DN26296_c0_g1_i1.p2 TRINITY_DN26296_c0_g1~~TRINITY_DN26296_c0_g1_i1.p2  ORF type:complete len:160 (-),score=39.79 TRINITY_DN26296_c0_g1_i1:67-546(-)
MIRRPPRSTQGVSSAASDVYKRQVHGGRVEVLSQFKPQQKLFDIVGVMSVMVLPKGDYHRPPNPRPDRNILARVHHHVDERRPIGVELYVIGAEYVPLGVGVSVTLGEGVPRQQTFQNVKTALYEFLWPLSPGGHLKTCLLYTSPSPRDLSTSRMPSSA